jgi:hypothetical protein
MAYNQTTAIVLPQLDQLYRQLHPNGIFIFFDNNKSNIGIFFSVVIYVEGF